MEREQGYTGFWKKLGCFLSVVTLIVFLLLFLGILYVVFINDKEWLHIL